MDLIASPDSFFDAVGKEYNDFRNAGFFCTSPKKALFIYRIEGKKIYTGIIGSNEISDIEDHKILGHEHTITEKEQSMMSLMLLRKAMIKPVLLAYDAHKAIDDFIRNFVMGHKPFFSIGLVHKNEKHTLWAVDKEEDIELVRSLFSKHILQAYIADGHHRAAITAMLVKKNYLHDNDDDKHPGLLCAFFPFDDLTIFDFNRVVDITMSETRFIASLSVFFDIQLLDHPQKPERKYQLTMFLHEEWYSLLWKSEILTVYKDKKVLLDVDLFNNFVLGNILNIENIRSATSVRYIEGVASMESLISACKYPRTAGFCMYPVSKDDVIHTSDARGVLPPKSTWFEPRMKNGLVIKEF